MNIGILGAARVAVYAMIEPARTVAGCRVAAVAARDPERAELYAAAHGIETVHATYAALIADPTIDLVYVATPPHNHAELATLSIGAGKAVLVEKPFAMDAGEAETICARAADAGVPVMEAMHSVHHPLLRRVQRIIEGGAIGDPRRITANFDAPIVRSEGEYRWHPELGGGALMDLGVYPLAWCRRLAGEAFEVLRSDADIDGVDIKFEADLRFANGIEAKIGSSFSGDRHRASLRIDGSQGYIAIDNFVGPHRGHRLSLVTAAGTANETVPGPTTYEAQLAAVRDTVMEGAPFPLPGDDYVRSMSAIDRVRETWLSGSR